MGCSKRDGYDIHVLLCPVFLADSVWRRLGFREETIDYVLQIERETVLTMKILRRIQVTNFVSLVCVITTVLYVWVKYDLTQSMCACRTPRYETSMFVEETHQEYVRLFAHVLFM